MIGSTIKQLLDSRDMRAGELARRLNIPATTLYSIIKRDNMKIDFDLLLRICDELNAPLELFCARPGMESPMLQEWDMISRYRRLDNYGRDIVDTVLQKELVRMDDVARTAPDRSIRLYFSPAAVALPAPIANRDYEIISISASSPADFAVRVNDSSLEPFLTRGEHVLVSRTSVRSGQAGLFFVGGEMRFGNYRRDRGGNTYILSVNRRLTDDDYFLPAPSSAAFCCLGRLLLPEDASEPVIED